MVSSLDNDSLAGSLRNLSSKEAEVSSLERIVVCALEFAFLGLVLSSEGGLVNNEVVRALEDAEVSGDEISGVDEDDISGDELCRAK